MSGFSTVDGFVEITESLTEMIKLLANEPSVGLYYIQQHTENAVPNVVNLHDQVLQKSNEATLHTEDLEDSITMVRLMKGCGFPIADEMIKDIKSSLTLMSVKQPKRGLIHSPASRFQMGRTSSWGPGSVNVQLDESNYFSNVIKSARQKASNLKWPQLDSKEQIVTKPQKASPQPAPSLSVASARTSSIPDTEADKLPVSLQKADKPNEEDENEEKANDDDDDVEVSNHKLSFMSEDYDDFKAHKEAKLEQWLEGTEGKNR